MDSKDYIFDKFCEVLLSNRQSVEDLTEFFDPFQLIVSFHVETSNLVCPAKQVTCFCMKFNTRLKWVKYFRERNEIYNEILKILKLNNTNELCLFII